MVVEEKHFHMTGTGYTTTALYREFYVRVRIVLEYRWVCVLKKQTHCLSHT